MRTFATLHLLMDWGSMSSLVVGEYAFYTYPRVITIMVSSNH